MGVSQILGGTLPKMPAETACKLIVKVEKKKNFNETTRDLAQSAFITKPLIQEQTN